MGGRVGGHNELKIEKRVLRATGKKRETDRYVDIREREREGDTLGETWGYKDGTTSSSQRQGADEDERKKTNEASG